MEVKQNVVHSGSRWVEGRGFYQAARGSALKPADPLARGNVGQYGKIDPAHQSLL